MLVIRLREGMHAVFVQRVEIIVRLRRIQRRTDGIDAGVRDRPRRETGVRVGVVRADRQDSRIYHTCKSDD